MVKIQNVQDKATVSSAWISLVVSSIILGMKFSAFYLTQSTAIFSDAIESIVNVVAAVIALFVMKAVAEPADDEHPYGHGKLEYFSAAFEGGLVVSAAIAVGFEAFRAFFSGRELIDSKLGLSVMVVATVINALLALHLRAVGKKHKSQALLASSSHVFSDVWTTVGILLALGLVFITGLTWLDPLIAGLVAVHLGYSGIQIVRNSFGALIDQVEIHSLQDLAASFQKHKRPWVIDIHQLKMIRSGKFHHIDAHLVVPEYWDISRTHEEMTRYEDEVVASYEFDGEIAFHVDPCERKYCEMCEVEDCPVRVKKMIAVRRMSADTLVRGPQSF